MTSSSQHTQQAVMSRFPVSKTTPQCAAITPVVVQKTLMWCALSRGKERLEASRQRRAGHLPCRPCLLPDNLCNVLTELPAGLVLQASLECFLHPTVWYSEPVQTPRSLAQTVAGIMRHLSLQRITAFVHV